MRYFEGLKAQNSLFLCSLHTRKKRNVMACSLEMHIQPSIEMICVTDGIFDIHINGTTEKIHTGEAAIIFPFQPHGYERYEGSEYVRFDFDQSLARDFFHTKNNKIGKSAVFKLSDVTKLIIENNFVKSSGYSRMGIQALLYSSLNDFTNQIELISINKDDNILIRAINYIKNNMEKPLQMKSVAKALGYSESYFSRAINKTAGFGFNTLLSMIRIEHAKTLLRESEKTTFDIVIECGFGSERSFYRQFKENVGESPLKYRTSFNK